MAENFELDDILKLANDLDSCLGSKYLDFTTQYEK